MPARSSGLLASVLIQVPGAEGAGIREGLSSLGGPVRRLYRKADRGSTLFVIRVIGKLP
jgi:hypothetical protein